VKRIDGQDGKRTYAELHEIGEVLGTNAKTKCESQGCTSIMSARTIRPSKGLYIGKVIY